jgi:hypothetical protein
LETQWLEAVQAKDKSALGKLLSESFELWTPSQSDPIPLEDWRQRAFDRPPKNFELKQIAVRAVSDNVSVVSFVLSQTFAGSGSTENQFVVDVWTKDSGGWRCTDRYASAVPPLKRSVQDVRPDGKQ